MKKLLLLFICLLTFLTYAQAPAIQGQVSYGGSQFDEATCVLPTTDGYILAGNSYSSDGQITLNHGNDDIWIVKTDIIGAIQWQKSYGGSGYDDVFSMKQTTDGGYILAGFSNSSDGDVTGGHGSYDYWVLKLSATGTIEWQKTYGGTGDDRAKDIQLTTDGGYILAGYTKSTDGDITTSYGSYDFWIVKIDATGTIQWQKSHFATTYDQANSIQQTSDGGYIFIGITGVLQAPPFDNLPPLNLQIWVCKLDASGDALWATAITGSNTDVGNKIVQTTDGGYIVTGYTFSNDGSISGNHGSSDSLLVKLNTYGSILWQKCYGGTGSEGANDIKITPDGGYIMAGYSSSSNGDVSNNIGNNGGNDFWLVKTDALGNMQWGKVMGSTDSDSANNIQITSDNGYVVVGVVRLANGNVTFSYGQQDYWAVKLAPDLLATQHYAQNKLALFPNPAKELVQFQSQNPISKIKIYDLFGKTVAEETNFNLEYINVSSLSQGVYLLEASSGEEKYITKFLKE